MEFLLKGAECIHDPFTFPSRLSRFFQENTSQTDIQQVGDVAFILKNHTLDTAKLVHLGVEDENFLRKVK